MSLFENDTVFSISVENESDYEEVMHILDENGMKWNSGKTMVHPERNYAWFSKGERWYLCVYPHGEVCRSGTAYDVCYGSEEFINMYGCRNQCLEVPDISVLLT